MKKMTLTGKTHEQLVELLQEKKAALTKANMTFGQKPSTVGIRRDIARIQTAVSALAKNN